MHSGQEVMMRFVDSFHWLKRLNLLLVFLVPTDHKMLQLLLFVWQPSNVLLFPLLQST